MILEKVELNNFMSFKEATINLANRGLVSVKGETLDKDGADSNGSGKSTLINAILWCNYGDPGKKLKSVDDVINKKAGKNCFVKCYWYDEDTDNRYIVARFRKHSVFKNSLLINKVEEDGNHDISKGTNPETQLVVNKTLGADQKTLEASCFSRQSNAPDIPGMSDGELKALLENVLPFDDLSTLYKKASGNYTDQLKVVKDLEHDQEIIGVRLEDAKKNYIATTERLDGWENEIETVKESLKSQIDGKKNEIFTLSSQLKDQDKLNRGVEKYQALVDAYDVFDLGQARQEVRFCENALAKAKKDYARVFERCPTCNQEIENRDALAWNLAKIEEEAVTALRLATAKRDNLEAKHSDFLLNKERLDKLNTLNRTQERQLVHIERAKADQERLEREVAQEYPNPHLAALTALAEQVSELTDQLFLTDTQLAQEMERLEVLKAVADSYSPKGVRYHILEQVTPALNASTNYYLNQLTDGKMVATWSTVTKLKSGDYKEAFSIDVATKDANGYGSLSGGEQRKVKLACFFALQDLIASRATKSIKLWCGDEIDHALDGAGLERLMNLLHEKVAKKSTILVISHNDLAAWIPNGALVIKQDGISKVRGYLSDY